MAHGLFGDVGAPAHVFIRAVCTGTDKSDFNIDGPAIFLGVLTQLADGVAQVGGEGTVDVRFEGI